MGSFFQVYGTRDENVTAGTGNSSFPHCFNNYGSSHLPTHLQLSQPEQSNFETPPTATK